MHNAEPPLISRKGGLPNIVKDVGRHYRDAAGAVSLTVPKKLVPEADETFVEFRANDVRRGSPVVDKLAKVLPEAASDVEETATVFQGLKEASVQVPSGGQVELQKAELAQAGIGVDLPGAISLSVVLVPTPEPRGIVLPAQ